MNFDLKDRTFINHAFKTMNSITLKHFNIKLMDLMPVIPTLQVCYFSMGNHPLSRYSCDNVFVIPFNYKGRLCLSQYTIRSNDFSVLYKVACQEFRLFTFTKTIVYLYRHQTNRIIVKDIDDYMKVFRYL